MFTNHDQHQKQGSRQDTYICNSESSQCGPGDTLLGSEIAWHGISDGTIAKEPEQAEEEVACTNLLQRHAQRCERASHNFLVARSP
jgi:hypothetical protein